MALEVSVPGSSARHTERIQLLDSGDGVRRQRSHQRRIIQPITACERIVEVDLCGIAGIDVPEWRVDTEYRRRGAVGAIREAHATGFLLRGDGRPVSCE